jgi:hypothetical protein
MKDKKYITTFGGAELNVMRLAKEVCLKTNWNVIIDEAQKYSQDYGIIPRSKYGNSDMKMRALWEKTERLGRLGRLSGSRQTIRIAGKSRGGRGSPTYGITMGIGGGFEWTVMVLIHELVHVAHLHSFNESVINGKRRPHDMMYNRIMLMAMKPYFNLSKSQCRPQSMGYSTGNGYAPTKIAQAHLEKVLGNGVIPKKLSKHFNKDLPKAVKVLTQEDKDKKVIIGFRTTLTSTKKGMNNHDGYCEVMSEEYGIEDGQEYIENLLEQVKPTMKIDGLSEQDKDILKWLITDLQIQWFEYDNWEFSESAYARKENRMFELWGFLNR